MRRSKQFPGRPHKQSHLSHRGKRVLCLLPNGKGHILSAAEAARRLGWSKGGRTTAARGTGHRWTTEEARQVARKAWATRWRFLGRIGRRIGRPSTPRSPIDHVALRARYAAHPTPAGVGVISYKADTREWWEEAVPLGGLAVRLSERTALIRLGHLPKARKTLYIPTHIVKVFTASYVKKRQR